MDSYIHPYMHVNTHGHTIIFPVLFVVASKLYFKTVREALETRYLEKQSNQNPNLKKKKLCLVTNTSTVLRFHSVRFCSVFPCFLCFFAVFPQFPLFSLVFYLVPLYPLFISLNSINNLSILLTNRVTFLHRRTNPT